MKIYLAHNFAAGPFLVRYAIPEIKNAGHTVSSTWVHEVSNNSTADAIVDLNDIQRSDALFMFSHQYGNIPGRGKYVELGYAIALEKKVFVIGPIADKMDCVFYNHPQVIYVETIQQALQRLGKL